MTAKKDPTIEVQVMMTSPWGRAGDRAKVDGSNPTIKRHITNGVLKPVQEVKDDGGAESQD